MLGWWMSTATIGRRRRARLNAPFSSSACVRAVRRRRSNWRCRQRCAGAPAQLLNVSSGRATGEGSRHHRRDPSHYGPGKGSGLFARAYYRQTGSSTQCDSAACVRKRSDAYRFDAANRVRAAAPFSIFRANPLAQRRMAGRGWGAMDGVWVARISCSCGCRAGEWGWARAASTHWGRRQ